ncbi:thermonuclease family protein [Viridibacillus arvi]|uniref:thermonuclease family protein n=1 Tax=Viridibacillus arvi TaxID=263475 RepID=UPI003D0232D5
MKALIKIILSLSLCFTFYKTYDDMRVWAVESVPKILNIIDLPGLFKRTSEIFKFTVSTPNKDAVVVKVVDGDTVKVKMNNKTTTIRMLLIDTPESVKVGVKPQKFSKEASKYLKKRLKKGTTVEIELGENATDKYGRTLAYVWLGDENMNLTMVKKGYARVAYVSKPNTKYLSEFKQSQKKAKSKKLKIWSIDGYATSNGFVD